MLGLIQNVRSNIIVLLIVICGMWYFVLEQLCFTFTQKKVFVVINFTDSIENVWICDCMVVSIILWLEVHCA